MIPLEDWMAQQRKRVAAKLNACERRIAVRQASECAAGDYEIESRRSDGTVTRVSVPPWYAARCERVQFE